MILIPPTPLWTRKTPICLLYYPSPTLRDKLYIFAAGLEKHFPSQSFEATLKKDNLQAAWKGRGLSLLIY